MLLLQLLLSKQTNKLSALYRKALVFMLQDRSKVWFSFRFIIYF